MQPSSSPAPAYNSRHRPNPPRAFKHPMVRWSALATGSLVGIGTWALAYVLGATGAAALGLLGENASLIGRLTLGLYGALSASMALGLAAYIAARTGGAQTEENALIYGLCLWSLSTITLVVVSTLTMCGVISPAIVAQAPVLAVGLAAVGLSPQNVEAAAVTPFLAMAFTLLISLWIALWSASRAQTQA